MITVIDEIQRDGIELMQWPMPDIKLVGNVWMGCTFPISDKKHQTC